MKILITGGAGFIGSNLADVLLERGEDVVCMDNFDPFYSPAMKEANLQTARQYDSFQLYRGDIADAEAVTRVFAENDFDLIVHLAAKAGVRPSIEDPCGYYQTNVNGTLNIFESARKQGVKKIVYASSSSVYGNNKKVPFSENDPVDNPISPYAATKKANELMAYNYHHLYGMDMFGLRFFTVYGRRGRPEMAIRKFSEMILNNEEVPVYGFGKPRRDFTYIDDIIQGILAAMERVRGYDIFNLGESATIRVDEMIALLEQALGKKAQKKMLPMQPGDVMETYADISKARKLLEYDPKTPIAEGIGKFVEWFLGQEF